MKLKVEYIYIYINFNSSFVGKFNKIDKTLARLTKGNREDTNH